MKVYIGILLIILPFCIFASMCAYFSMGISLIDSIGLGVSVVLSLTLFTTMIVLGIYLIGKGLK